MYLPSNTRSLSTVSMSSPDLSVNRLQKDYRQLLTEPLDNIWAHPLEDNIHEWHYVFRGPADTPYADGLYHGKLIFNNDYPISPPSLYMMTPNGKFAVNRSICVSGISALHPNQWSPAQTVSSILISLFSFMIDDKCGPFYGSAQDLPQRRGDYNMLLSFGKNFMGHPTPRRMPIPGNPPVAPPMRNGPVAPPPMRITPLAPPVLPERQTLQPVGLMGGLGAPGDEGQALQALDERKKLFFKKMTEMQEKRLKKDPEPKLSVEELAKKSWAFNLNDQTFCKYFPHLVEVSPHFFLIFYHLF